MRRTLDVAFFILGAEGSHERGALCSECGVRVLLSECRVVREQLLLDGLQVGVVIFLVGRCGGSVLR